MMRRRQVLVLLTGAAAMWGAGPLAVPSAAGAGAVAAAITPASGPWAAVPRSPLRGRVGPLAVRADRRMIVRGGTGRTMRAARTFASAASSWGQAIDVPGLAALNAGGNAGVASVSCTAAGDCAAGGSYRDRHGHDQGFAVGEWHGRWGRAIEVPGLGALNTGGAAYVWSVSCASPGNCAAGGSYQDRHRHNQGFVAVERRGRWRRAIEVPGLGALNKGGDAGVGPVSCTAAGNCAVGGSYRDGHRNYQGFVAAERRGRWGRAIEVPGLGALNEGDAAVTSVGCGSTGNCAAGGFYANDVVSRDIGGLFVVAERGGRWGKAVALPADGEANSISCTSAGTCLAGGQAACENCYFFVGDAFVVRERAGRWGSVRFIPGLRKLEHYVDPEIAGSWINSVACTSAGACVAGGGYEYNGQDQSDDHGFVALERNGVWAEAIEVPGLAALNAGGDAQVMEVSCGSAGDCSAGGYYRDADGHYQGFVAVERNGA